MRDWPKERLKHRKLTILWNFKFFLFNEKGFYFFNQNMNNYEIFIIRIILNKINKLQIKFIYGQGKHFPVQHLPRIDPD